MYFSVNHTLWWVIKVVLFHKSGFPQKIVKQYQLVKNRETMENDGFLFLSNNWYISITFRLNRR